MTTYEQVHEYIVDQPKARLRKNKNRAIGNLMMKNYSFEMDKAKMADMVGEILSADRAWRKVMEENVHLRGEDYDDKAKLEEKKKVELGYPSKTYE